MNPTVVKQLSAINQAFYSQFASQFSETRPCSQMRLNKIVRYIPDGAAVIDIGCGNGRMAERLDREGLRLTYLGIDAAPELIAIAAAKSPALRQVGAEFRVADILQPGWAAQMIPPVRSSSRDVSRGGFDVALLLAVLHHVPSRELRAQVLRDIQSLLRPGGILVMTNWQFLHNARMHRRIVEWNAVGIDKADLEEGDALLVWRRGGAGYRYCHWLTKAEVRELAAGTGFRVLEQFFGDANQNLYSVLRREEDSHPRVSGG